ncbi:MAG: apolipoprotein N-acyltransferase [Rickettsiales bacterium]
MTSIINLSGWRRNVLLFLLGVCATLTLAPFYIFPLIIPAYGGLFLLIRNSKKGKRAFADGWWWGWGFYISGLYWFCIALLTDPEKFAWAIPPTIFGLNAIIALYPAIACLLFFHLFIKNQEYRNNYKIVPVVDCFGFSLIWLLLEYARGHLFSGFPWNLAGYSFAFSDASMQAASIFGIYGLTFFTLLLAVTAAIIKNVKLPAAIIWGMFFCLTIWGYLRIDHTTVESKAVETNTAIRLVQANIQQHHKWNKDLQKQHLDEHIKLTLSKGIENIDYVIWSETSIPFPIRSDSGLARYIGKYLPQHTKLMAGGLRIEQSGDDFNFYNSLIILNNKGSIIDIYDKHILVPFGEFLPFRSLIPKSWKLPVGDKDFSKGSGVRTIKLDKLPEFSPLICYESIFPDAAVDITNRPKWLLNITNDAWFGNSTGPYQHFQMARMRAVEHGVPMVRVANTGITAYVNRYGIVQKQIGLSDKGIVDININTSESYNTVYFSIYSRINNLTVSLCIIACVVLGSFFRKLIKY